MRLTTNQPRIYLPDVVGRGYGAFWRFTGRYCVCKGSRASKKSTTTALNFIYRMMKYPGANLLVIRKTYRTLRDSCFTQLLWAIHRLQVEAFWSWKESPLEITYKPTGQKIYFRGMDDPLKLTSITAQSGVLCWVWIEEAYEIMNESDFNTLDESIRGECAPPLFKQITLTFNPWNQKHWLKARFFDVQDPDILAITTNYQCNEWLDKQDLRLFERMKATNPRRYNVAGLGEWGIVEGLIYEQWREAPFDPAEISRTGKLESVFGLDFGFTNDPTAFFCGLLDIPARRLYVFDELYERGLTNDMIAKRVTAMGYGKVNITADGAEPKSIAELRGMGLRVHSAAKGADSIRSGIQWIQNLEIIIHPRCINFLTEISNYTWAKDKFGKMLDGPIDDFNHLMDAMRYGLEKFIVGKKWTY